MQQRCGIRAALLVVSIVLAASPALAERRAWDSKRVASLAGQAGDALQALLDDPEINAKQATTMQQREHDAAVSSARRMLPWMRELKQRLDSGYTGDETEAFWARIGEVRGDISAYARHSWLPAATRERADKVNGLMDQLASYYEDV